MLLFNLNGMIVLIGPQQCRRLLRVIHRSIIEWNFVSLPSITNDTAYVGFTRWLYYRLNSGY